MQALPLEPVLQEFPHAPTPVSSPREGASPSWLDQAVHSDVVHKVTGGGGEILFETSGFHLLPGLETLGLS